MVTIEFDKKNCSVNAVNPDEYGLTVNNFVMNDQSTYRLQRYYNQHPASVSSLYLLHVSTKVLG